MIQQPTLNLKEDIKSVEEYQFEPIKGYPMLNWKGKRPFRSTQYYPAQLKENHGSPVNDWMNQIYWGDNLQVMSHLLKKYRGQVKLIYIDPPFDSKADYKKKIQLKGKTFENNNSTFEEKQYTDIWSNDEYLQFLYERLILMRELLAENGSIYVHCDWHKSHYIRCMMDEVFGSSNFRNEIIWVRSTNPKGSQHDSNKLSTFTDTIFLYTANENAALNIDRIRKPLSQKELREKYYREDEKGRYYDGPIVSSTTMGERKNLVYEYKGFTPPSSGWRVKREVLEEIDRNGNLGWTSNRQPFRKLRPEDDKGKPIGNIWNDISLINSQADERLGYPTQKPEALIERILILSTNPGDIIFDCFMGSGTAQAVAMKLGLRFLGADINLGAVQTTTKRLLNVAKEVNSQLQDKTYYTGFTVYNVNHYEIFRNPIQAKELLLEALEIQKLPDSAIFDGEKDGFMVKIMPVNRIATKADLNELITNIDYRELNRRKAENKPNQPVESIMLVCMGHEPDLAATLKNELRDYKVEIQVVDILRDKANLQFKRDSEAEIVIEADKLRIKQFYPMNLLQKLSLEKESVEDWRELVESIMIDYNYDGAIFEPTVVDVPEKNNLVRGDYKIPANAGTIHVKITDLLSESLEKNITF